jgi:hypothetical protein
MSQHDYVIENQTFPATRADLNNAFGAIVSQNSGASAPSTTYAYQLWYDTSNNKLKQRNADNDAWIDLFDVNQTTDVATASSTGTFSGDINMNGGTLKILFTRDDTETIAGNPLGAIEFAHTDTDDAGTAAKIIGEGNGGAGEGRIAFYAGTPSALTEKLRIDGDGLKFNGDTATANALDDYEEGTWTPVFADAVSGGNASSTSATEGTYIKIGSLVAITCKFQNISISGLTTTAAAFIRGLPYVSQGRSVNSPWMQSVDVGTNPVHIVARIINTAQDIRFDQINDDNTDTTLSVAAFDSGVADVQLSMTYQTTF